MKKVFIVTKLLISLLITTLRGQPNICRNPPAGYQKGGDFEISVTNNGITSKTNYLCLTEKVDDARISVTDKSTLSNVRYMFGVDNTTNSLPSLTPLITYRDISGDNAGEFWIIQWGEESGQKKLNCQKVHIDVSSRPQANISSCKNQDLTLSLQTNEAVSYYSINWNDGNPAQKVNYIASGVVVNHSFSQQSLGDVKIVAVYDNTNLQQTCNSVEIPITPPSISQITSLETQDFGSQISAILKIKNPNQKALNLLYSEDNGITYKTAFPTNLSVAFVSSLPRTQVCFKIQNKENPNCIYETEPVCSIIPKTDNTSYGQIDLTWNPSGSQTDYTIKRLGGTPLSNTTTQTTYVDKNLDCNGNYNYQITGNYKNSQSVDIEVISSFVRSNANFTPTLQAKQGLVVTVLPNSQTNLEILDASGSLKYFLYRSEDSNIQNFTKIAEITTNSYTDIVDASKSKYCYKIRHEDACGYLSPLSESMCTIFLKGQDQSLLWNTPTETPNATINYDVNRLNPTTTLINQIITNYSVDKPQEPTEKYQIEAYLTLNINGKDYKRKILSNQVELNFETKIFTPNAFTPNGDDINDKWQVLGDLEKTKSFNIKIFNNWGNVVYQSDNWLNGWDGQVNDVKAETGMYIYLISYVDTFGKKQQKRGVLRLIR